MIVEKPVVHLELWQIKSNSCPTAVTHMVTLRVLIIVINNVSNYPCLIAFSSYYKGFKIDGFLIV